jgi:hypothetical protein
LHEFFIRAFESQRQPERQHPDGFVEVSDEDEAAARCDKSPDGRVRQKALAPLMAPDEVFFFAIKVDGRMVVVGDW